MSAIFGLVNPGSSGEQFERDLYAGSTHRGGDDTAAYRDENVILGVRGAPGLPHCALIKDEAAGVVAAIEGEIYNVDELGRACELRAAVRGCETVIPLYLKYGRDFPRQMNGVFAIALWDSRDRTLFLVRDHLGSRSLFFAEKRGALLFGSTLRAIRRTGLAGGEVSRARLHEYFSSTAVCAPGTLFTDISCVRPGAVVTCRDGRCSDHDYWKPQEIEEDYSPPEREWAERVREVLLDAILIRARGTRYGSLVSGGIDTSVIAATLASRFHSPERLLPAFSIAFREAFYSDAALQDVMYASYPLEKHCASIDAREFADILTTGAGILDKPVNDNAYVGMYRAFQLARQTGCEAVFDGEAADELFFTGHALGELAFQKYLRIPRWFRQRVLRGLFPTTVTGDSLPRRARRLLYRVGLTDEERILTRLPSFYRHATPILRGGPTAEWAHPHAVGMAYLAQCTLKDPLNRYHYGLTKTFLPDDLLFKNERMATAHGVINRTPFIDHRLVELAFRISAKVKLVKPTPNDDGTKQIYKTAIAGLIPNEILRRKKTRGFSQPSRVWYRKELRDLAYDVLLSPTSQIRQYVDTDYARRVLSDHVSGRADNDYLVSSLLILELWLRAYARTGPTFQ